MSLSTKYRHRRPVDESIREYGAHLIDHHANHYDHNKHMDTPRKKREKDIQDRQKAQLAYKDRDRGGSRRKRKSRKEKKKGKGSTRRKRKCA